MDILLKTEISSVKKSGKVNALLTFFKMNFNVLGKISHISFKRKLLKGLETRNARKQFIKY